MKTQITTDDGTPIALPVDAALILPGKDTRQSGVATSMQRAGVSTFLSSSATFHFVTEDGKVQQQQTIGAAEGYAAGYLAGFERAGGKLTPLPEPKPEPGSVEAAQADLTAAEALLAEADGDEAKATAETAVKEAQEALAKAQEEAKAKADPPADPPAAAQGQRAGNGGQRRSQRGS